MTLPRFLLLSFLVTGFVLGSVQGYSAPRGENSTYAPLLFGAPIPPLPDEPLLLIGNDNDPDLIWVNGTNTYQRVIADSDMREEFAQISPDGNQVLYYEQGNAPSAHKLVAAIGGTARELPFPSLDSRLWSPDSRYISYKDGFNLSAYDTTTGLTNTLTFTESTALLWHPQSLQLYYTLQYEIGGIYRVSVDGSNNALVYSGPGDETLINVRPDGRLLMSERSEKG